VTVPGHNGEGCLPEYYCRWAASAAQGKRLRRADMVSAVLAHNNRVGEVRVAWLVVRLEAASGHRTDPRHYGRQ
jgi:hypothetical protein